MVEHHADTAEHDNGTLESFNAQARRRVKAALQQKVIDLTDLDVFQLFSQSRAEGMLLWGQGPVGTQTNSDSMEPPRMQGGGGGLCRKFTSKYKDTFKDASGTVSLAVE